MTMALILAVTRRIPEGLAAMQGGDIVDGRIGQSASGAGWQAPAFPSTRFSQFLGLRKRITDSITHPLRGPTRHFKGLTDVVERQTVGTALHLHRQPY